MTNNENAPDTGHPWYRSPYWLLLLPIVLFGLWMWHISGSPETPTTATTAGGVSKATPTPTPAKIILTSIGPNLLENPGFMTHGRGWTAYHNAQPMSVTYNSNNASASISLMNASNSVQELYQSLNTKAGVPLVARGIIQVSGATLPAQASVNILFVDS